MIVKAERLEDVFLRSQTRTMLTSFGLVGVAAAIGIGVPEAIDQFKDRAQSLASHTTILGEETRLFEMAQVYNIEP